MKRNHKWLTIYLQDHYAGATAGSRLFRRVADSHSDPRVRQVVGALAAQVEKDQRSLAKIMRSLKIRHSRPKEGLAWGAEKLGRLKPNGTVLRRSPLTDVVELEGLSLAVEGKVLGMKTLLTLADAEPRLDAKKVQLLLDRATAQKARLEELRLARANEVFARDAQEGQGRPTPHENQEAREHEERQEARGGHDDQKLAPMGNGSRQPRRST
jgi:hypothetical protein